MSKQDLETLISAIEKGLTKEFRKEIDVNNLCFQYDVDTIAREIKDELSFVTPAPNNEISDNKIRQIAETIVLELNNAFMSSKSPTLTRDLIERQKQVDAGKIFISNEKAANTFRILSNIVRPIRYKLIKLVEEAGAFSIAPITKKYRSTDETKQDTIVQSKEFFNIEHLSTVSDLRIASEFTKASGSRQKAIEIINKFKQFASNETKNILEEYILTIVSRTQNTGTIIKDLQLSLEWKSEKRNKEAGRQEILARRRVLAQELRKIINENIISGETLEASDSVEKLTAKKYFSMVDAAVKQTGRIKKRFQPNNISKKTTKASKAFKIESKVSSRKTITLGPSGLQPKNLKVEKTTPSMEGPSPLEIIAYINSRLQEKIEKNMIPPALESRTGRFSGSVKVLNMIRTRQGLPSFEYTYDKNPYQVFEMGVGRSPWATPQRDPRKLIDKSIREIAAEMLQSRLYTRRI